jgi:hypothetical protein
LIVGIASWRLVHAFIEKEECYKEEKTYGQSWEITHTSFCAHADPRRSSATPLTRLTYPENGRYQLQA